MRSNVSVLIFLLKNIRAESRKITGSCPCFFSGIIFNISIILENSNKLQIWHRVHRKMERVNSLAQIMAYVDAKFVGISSAEQVRKGY